MILTICINWSDVINGGGDTESAGICDHTNQNNISHNFVRNN